MIAGEDCFTARMGRCSLSANTTEVTNAAELFIVTNSH